MEAPSSHEQKCQVRFPRGMFEDMKQLATLHDRSFNGEIIHALRLYIAQQKEKECAQSQGV